MENEIVVQGKKIDIEKLSDDQIVNLFRELSIKELKIDEKILKIEKIVEKMKKNI